MTANNGSLVFRCVDYKKKYDKEFESKDLRAHTNYLTETLTNFV